MTALRAIVIGLMTTLVFASPIISAESAVELDSIIHLSESDLSIKGIAENKFVITGTFIRIKAKNSWKKIAESMCL